MGGMIVRKEFFMKNLKDYSLLELCQLYNELYIMLDYEEHFLPCSPSKLICYMDMLAKYIEVLISDEK